MLAAAAVTGVDFHAALCRRRRAVAAAVPAKSCKRRCEEASLRALRTGLHSLRPATTDEGSKAASRWHILKPIDARLARPAVASP